MHFGLSREKGTATKNPSARGRGDGSAKQKPKYEFEDPRSEAKNNDDDDSQIEADIDRRLFLASLRAPKQHENKPTRYENEDPKADDLFQSVPGYKEGLRLPEDQKKGPTPYVYPPDNLMRGPSRPTRRVTGEDPAADQLLSGASQRQQPTQSEEAPVPKPSIDEESPIIRLAREIRDLRLSGRDRKEGEDPAADALFGRPAKP